MVRTGIPVSVLENEDLEVVMTMIDLLAERAEASPDPYDPASWETR
jgi:hypothetical protein